MQTEKKIPVSSPPVKLELELENPLQIEIKGFSGPLDLLLALIQQKKRDIFSIPLAEICQPYLEKLAERQTLNLAVEAEFIKIAADLIWIKAKSLLPVYFEGEDEEAKTALELEQQLKERLVEYEKFRKLSQELDKRDRLFRDFFNRHLVVEEEGLSLSALAAKPRGEKDTAHRPNLYLLLKSYQAALQKQQLKAPYDWEQKVWEAEARFNALAAFFNEEERVLFTELLRPKPVRPFLITTLVALLELCRQQKIHIDQKYIFADFWCYKTSGIAVQKE